GDKTPGQKTAALKQRDEMVRQRVEARANELAAAHQGRIEHVYDHVFKGFSTEMSEEQALALSQNPQVKFVEEDAEVSAGQITSSCVFTGQQSGATWGVDRI